MKLIVAILLLNCYTCFSQVVVSFPEYMVVYRGYSNILEIGTRDKINYKLIKLSCEGALLTYKENRRWILNPFTTEDTLEIVMFHSKTKKIIGRFNYEVRNLPDPIVFFGATIPNGLISKHENRLFAAYINSPLRAAFSVQGGVAVVDNRKFKIESNKLGSDYLEYIQNMPEGTTVRIEAWVIGPDKIKRVIISEYNL